MMLVKDECVDQCKVARFVEQRTWVVLQTEVGVPHNDAVQRDAVLTRVHQTERNIVAAHKHGKRIFVRNGNWKRGVPPGGVVKRNFWRVDNGKFALTQIVFAAKRLQRINGAE